MPYRQDSTEGSGQELPAQVYHVPFPHYVFMAPSGKAKTGFAPAAIQEGCD
jgi:hypothetical protein